MKTGLLPEEQGRLYDKLFEDRQEGDYLAFTRFLDEEVRDVLVRTERLLRDLEALVEDAHPA